MRLLCTLPPTIIQEFNSPIANIVSSVGIARIDAVFSLKYGGHESEAAFPLLLAPE
jgi:hypothetical protein